jgi:hypothetical protein
MGWEGTYRRLRLAEQRVAQDENNVARARRAMTGTKCSAYTINAEEALKCLEAMLEHDIEIRDRLKDQLRLLTH